MYPILQFLQVVHILNLNTNQSIEHVTDRKGRHSQVWKHLRKEESEHICFIISFETSSYLKVLEVYYSTEMRGRVSSAVPLVFMFVTIFFRLAG